VAKPFEISKWVVWEAYRKVKANRGAAGVDEESINEFERDLKGNLYKLWNRMSSGTYFPPPVLAVQIPKAAVTGSARSGCRRRRHSAASSSDDLGFVVVTHPLHPLSGQRLEVLYAKARGAERVLVSSGGVSGLITVPLSWTDWATLRCGSGCRSRGWPSLL
jgi:hypothetical protein